MSKVAKWKIAPVTSFIRSFLFPIFSRKILPPRWRHIFRVYLYLHYCPPRVQCDIAFVKREGHSSRSCISVPTYRYILRSTKRLAEVKRRIAWLAMGHLIRPESRGKEVRSAFKVLGTYPPLVCASLKTRRHRGKREGRSYGVQEEEKIGGRRASIVILVNYSH